MENSKDAFDLVISVLTDIMERLEVIADRMEKFVKVFEELEEREAKLRMLGDDMR